jgi:glycosyltransferase involved in cell wall biosynthesis
MKILIISPRIPHSLTDGAWLCLYNVVKHMTSNHKFYLLSLSEGTNDKHLFIRLKEIFTEIHVIKKAGGYQRSRRSLIRNLMSWNSGLMKNNLPHEVICEFRKKMMGLIASKNIDIVHCHLLRMSEFLNDVEGCVRILHLIDSETLRMRRIIAMLHLWELPVNLQNIFWYLRLRNFEKNAVSYFDASITVGKKDYDMLKGMSPDANVYLIPNGVDTDYFHPLPLKNAESPTVMFVGNMKTPPNIDAVKYFYYQIYPLIKLKIPEVRFFIVGAFPPKEILRLSEDRSVTVTGFVEDIRTFIAEADIVVCPMRKGGGIKNKILEAMSSGRAVVSTSLGAEGIDAKNGENIIVSDSPAEFAESVINILNDKHFRDSIRKKALELIQNHYTWDRCSREYDILYQDLIRNKTDDSQVQPR